MKGNQGQTSSARRFPGRETPIPGGRAGSPTAGLIGRLLSVGESTSLEFRGPHRLPRDGDGRGWPPARFSWATGKLGEKMWAQVGDRPWQGFGGGGGRGRSSLSSGDCALLQVRPRRNKKARNPRKGRGHWLLGTIPWLLVPPLLKKQSARREAIPLATGKGRSARRGGPLARRTPRRDWPQVLVVRQRFLGILPNPRCL